MSNSNSTSTLLSDLFSSLISDIKTHTGKDPLLPWLRGVWKMRNSLPPQLLKEKLPQFLQKCVQTFEIDRHYTNDLLYLRIWLQLVLKFNLTDSGLLCVLPWLTMTVFANIGGWIVDTLVSKGLSITVVCKITQSIGFLGPVFFLRQLSHIKTPALADLCMACSQLFDAGADRTSLWFDWVMLLGIFVSPNCEGIGSSPPYRYPYGALYFPWAILYNNMGNARLSPK